MADEFVLLQRLANAKNFTPTERRMLVHFERERLEALANVRDAQRMCFQIQDRMNDRESLMRELQIIVGRSRIAFKSLAALKQAHAEDNESLRVYRIITDKAQLSANRRTAFMTALLGF